MQVAISADQQSETFGQELVQAALNAFSTNTIDIIVNNAVITRFQADCLRHFGNFADSGFDRELEHSTKTLNPSQSLISIGSSEPMFVDLFCSYRLPYRISRHRVVASSTLGVSSRGTGQSMEIFTLAPRRH
jgi:NAD(P)-dependent dehydrogenase (short-subunit alcohol dehydrogenase family)